MICIGGTVRIDKNTTATVAVNARLGIELDLGHGPIRLGFDDAEHLAGLLSDLARVVRHTSGIGALEVV